MPIRLDIKKYRKKKGFTQVELSERSGVRRAAIVAFEQEAPERRPKMVGLDTLEQLANALGIDASLLIVHTGKPKKRGK